jgi:hypothetical protein
MMLHLVRLEPHLGLLGSSSLKEGAVLQGPVTLGLEFLPTPQHCIQLEAASHQGVFTTCLLYAVFQQYLPVVSNGTKAGRTDL